MIDKLIISWCTLAQNLISQVNLCEGSVLMLQYEVALVDPHVISCSQDLCLPHGLESLQQKKSFSHSTMQIIAEVFISW